MTSCSALEAIGEADGPRCRTACKKLIAGFCTTSAHSQIASIKLCLVRPGNAEDNDGVVILAADGKILALMVERPSHDKDLAIKPHNKQTPPQVAVDNLSKYTFCAATQSLRNISLKSCTLTLAS